MALDVFLRDPTNMRSAAVEQDGSISVVLQNRPPVNGAKPIAPFAQTFVDSSDSSDMRVDGSATPVDFTIPAISDSNVYVKTISVLIQDNGANLNGFGALSALTNGLSFIYITTELGEFVIQDGIKTNLDFIRLGQSTGAVGDGTSAYRLDTSGAGADTYLPLIDLQQTFGAPYGLRLRPGTSDRLIFRVNDNLSAGLDGFNIRAFGVQV